MNKEHFCIFYCACLAVKFQKIKYAIHFSYKNNLLPYTVYKPHILHLNILSKAIQTKAINQRANNIHNIQCQVY